MNTRFTAFCIIFVTGVCLSGAIAVETAMACETRVVRVLGNLNSQSDPVQSIPDVTEPIPTQVAAAQASVDIDLFDSNGTRREAVVLFFLEENSQSQWLGRLIVTDEAYVIPSNASRVVANAGLSYTENGERLFEDVDIGAPFSWEQGASNEYVEFSLVPTNLPQQTSLSVSQDGGEGGCTQYGNLDFDGDGKDDFAIFRPTLGIWAILRSSVNPSDAIIRQWGLPGDYPMPGDYDGDGKADLVVWRPSDGNWYICKSSVDFDCTQPTIVQFGLPGDSPIEGDFDGDRILDHAVWRPSNGTFYYRSSRNTELKARQWGLPGDIPLQAGRNAPE